jgi:DNA-binding response OmpR family regulator
VNILIIDDEKPLADALTALLRQNKYDVTAAYSGHAGEEHALSGIYDLILLDIMLPGKSGLEVLRALREKGISTPILLLTAKSEVEDKIAGLDRGADDYLTKPFITGELLARIRAMTRRKGEYIGDALSFGGTILNKNTHKLICGPAEVQLSHKEYQIMEILMQNNRQIILRERLIEKVWGFDSEAEYNAIEVYISFIRKKLTVIQSGIHIKAVRGVGYCLEESG